MIRGVMIAWGALGIAALSGFWAGDAAAQVNLTAPGGTTFTIQDTQGGQLTGPAGFGNWPQLCVRTCPANGCQDTCAGGDIYDAANGASAGELNDRQRLTAARSLAGLSVRRRVFVPSAGQANANQFVRYVDSMSNATGQPITVSVRLGAVDGSTRLTAATQVWRTRSDDATLEPEDRWFVADDANPDGGSGAVGVVTFGAGARTAPASLVGNLGGQAGAYSWEYRNVTVPANSTISLMTIVVHEPQREPAIDEADYLLRANPSDLLFGLTDSQRREIYNFDVDPTNGSPLADGGGPYSADEGSQIQLQANRSFDPEGQALTYVWDLDLDGDFDDAAGANAFTTFPDNGIFTVRVRVTDAGGKTDVDTARITVRNVAPLILGVNADSPINEGSVLDVLVNASDPGADTLTYQYDWEGTGTFVAGDARAQRRYPRDGTFNARVRVTDDDGDSSETGFQVVVNNVAPEIFQVITNSPTLEGSLVNIQVVAQDAGGDPITYAYDLDDNGSFETTGVGLNQVTTRFYDDGLYRVRIRLTDDRGAFVERTENISILNAPPRIIEITQTGPVLEGQAIVVEVGADDPSNGADVLNYSFDFDGDGDYNDDVVNQADPFAEHIYRQQGTYTVGVRVRDDDGGQVLGNIEVQVINAPPVISAFVVQGADVDGGGRFLVREGVPFTLAVTAADPGNDLLRYTYDVNGDGGDDILDSARTTQVVTINRQGDYTLRVRVADGDGGIVSRTLVVRVNNVIPELTVDIDTPQNEGAEVVIGAQVVDPGDDELSFSYDFDGDGTYEVVNSFEAIARHVYTQQGVYRVTVQVNDGDVTVTSSADIEIVNVAPTIRITSNSPIAEGSNLVLTAEVSDPGDDRLTLRWTVRGDVFEQVIETEEDLVLRIPILDDALFNVTAVALDEDGGESEEARTQVLVTNVAPQFLPIDFLPRAQEGTPFNYVPPVSDPAGVADPLRFAILNPPAGVTVEAETGRVVWTPTYDQYLASPIRLRLTVNDGDGGSAESELVVSVDPRDEDNDGIPDTYERNTCAPGRDCLDPTNGADADLDFDNDGVSNRDEWMSGRDPFAYNGPGVPEVLAPVDGERVPTLNPTFEFSRVSTDLEEDVAIEVEAFADPDLTVPVFNSGPIAQPEEGGLSWLLDQDVFFEDVTYYWHARSLGISATSEWTLTYQLRTNASNELPTAPVPRAPLDNSVLSELAPQLEVLPSFDPDEEELQYIFRIYRASTGEAIQSGAGELRDGVVVYDTSTASLAENGVYAWDVVARDRVAASEPSPRWTFTINAANQVPTNPRILEPANNTVVDTHRPTVVVGGSNDPDDAEFAYLFAFKLRGGSEYLAQSERQPAVNGTEVSYTVDTDLIEDTWHTVEVRAVDAVGESGVVVADFFVSQQNDPPPPPPLEFPEADGRINASEAFVIWSEVLDPEEGAVTYSVEICEADVPDNCQAYAPQEQRGRDVTDFVQAGVTYEWTVTAYDDEGLSSGPSTARRFTIEGKVGGGGSTDDGGCNSTDSRAPGFAAVALLLLGLGLRRRRD